MGEIFLGNIRGPQGETGTGFKVLGYYTTIDELTADIKNPSVGDAYGVGSAHPYDIYIYSSNKGWVNNGALQGGKGEDGADGTNATITDVTATVDETTGTPTVSVTMGGSESKRSFAFAFSGLKGEQGEKGEAGDGATVDINEQTPTYTEATSLETLTSGEKIIIAFGKIKKAITEFISHLADTTKHITSSERTIWNNKAPSGHGLGTIGDGTYNDTFNNVLNKGCGFYQIKSLDESPNNSNYWFPTMQISRSVRPGEETGAQLVFLDGFDYESEIPRVWFRTAQLGVFSDWFDRNKIIYKEPF